MPRGELQRTKIKREILASVPTAIAVEEAKRKIQQRMPLTDKLKEIALDVLRNIKANDVVKLSAWVGATILVHGVIKANVDLVTTISKSFLNTRANLLEIQ